MQGTATHQSANHSWLSSLWSAATSAGSYTSSTLANYFAEKPVSVAEHVTRYINNRNNAPSVKAVITFSTRENGKREVTKYMPKEIGAREVKALSLCKGLPHVTQGKGLCLQDAAIVIMDDAGMDLFELMKAFGKALPEPLFKSASIQFMEGLAAMHTEGLIHNDIKPDNIAIDESEHVTLIDLGETTTTEEAKNHPQLQTTAGYLAPECFAEKVTPSKATDIFAAGASFYELLTGSNFIPYPSAEEGLESNKIACSSRKTLEDHVDHALTSRAVPQKYHHLLKSMLAYSPEDRPTSQDVLNQLQKIHN